MSERRFEQELVGKVLVRRARNATHASLFFLYHFQSTGSGTLDAKLAQDRDTALERVRALIDGVHLPAEVADGAPAESPLLGTDVARRAPLGVFTRLWDMVFEPAAPAGSASSASVASPATGWRRAGMRCHFHCPSSTLALWTPTRWSSRHWTASTI